MSRSIKELQEQKKRLEAEIAKQMNMERAMVGNIDVFLALTPNHTPPYMQKKGGDKHTDENPYAVQFCDRCLLLVVKNTKKWVDGVGVTFYLDRGEEEDEESVDEEEENIDEEDDD